MKRINKYYNCLWNRFKGIHDAIVLDELPETLKIEILSDLLSKLIIKKLFFFFIPFIRVIEKIRFIPNEKGLILEIIKSLKIMVINKV